jgi:hypothetical protein
LEKRNEKRESEGKIIPQFEGGFSFINYTKSLHMWKLKKIYWRMILEDLDKFF